jgi:hippurate hydrolase
MTLTHSIKNLRELRREFHQFPELGFQERKTKKKVANFLRAKGLEVIEGVGVIGILKSGEGSKTIGLRADMDALPIQETSKHSYSSMHPGVMHACGHDGHMTMLLGAAEKLADNLDFNGTVIFIFQPNEENGLGAKAMLNEDLLSRFPMSEIFALHNLPGTEMGRLMTRKGLICSSESLFEIQLKGQGGHASMPQVGRDTISIGSEIIQSLQNIISKRLPPGSGSVISVTEFTSDGARNVLPGTSFIKGDVRSRNEEDRLEIKRLMTNIVDGISRAHEIESKFSFETEFVETINSGDQTNSVIEVAEELGLSHDSNCEPMSFSEDFAHFSNVVPGCFFLLGNGKSGCVSSPLHSSSYDFNDELLPIGIEIWSKLVRNILPLNEVQT